MKFFPYAALSFGAGVQSSALLLLIKHDPQLLIDAVGHLPNKAYFADTGAEPQAIYKHLELMHACSSIPIKVVNNGSLLSADTQNGIQPRTFPHTSPRIQTVAWGCCAASALLNLRSCRWNRQCGGM